MKQFLLIIFMIASQALVKAQSSCDDALSVVAGVYTVDLIAGEIPSPVCSEGFDIASGGEWYTYTALNDYNVTISSSFVQNTIGYTIDTRFQIYSGECGNFECLGGDNDSGMDVTSEYTISLLAGTTIYIAWDDAFSEEGFVWEISESEYNEPIIPPVTFTPSPLAGEGSNRGIVDMNGDFLDDIVRVSGEQGIHIAYQQTDGTLLPVSMGNIPAQHFPAWSLTAGDIDGNGRNDLVYGGGQGVSIMYANEDGSNYIETSFPETVISQRGNCVDIDNDGSLDVFMCHDLAANVYYLNDGQGNLAFNQGGLGDVENGGNYGSIWVDYNHDGNTDLFIAKSREGESEAKNNEMHRNDGNLGYTNVSESLGLSDPVQTWSSAWGDFDNDGDLDVFIGANSFSDGSHKLLMNDGNGNFTDVTEGSGLENFQGTGTENVTHDFDNDGYLDILGMGGAMMFNNGDMTFTYYDMPVTNGAIGDINNDGFLDILNTELQVNDGNNNNWLKVTLVGTESNSNGIGAMIHVYTENDQILTRQIRSGDGFRYMSSLNAYFGLGTAIAVDSMVVTWPSGIVNRVNSPSINGVTEIIEFVEEPNAIGDVQTLNISLYPNPATEFVYLEGFQNYTQLSYTVVDISGKVILQGNNPTNALNISVLKSGTYILKVNADEGLFETKFIKN